MTVITIKRTLPEILRHIQSIPNELRLSLKGASEEEKIDVFEEMKNALRIDIMDVCSKNYAVEQMDAQLVELEREVNQEIEEGFAMLQKMHLFEDAKLEDMRRSFKDEEEACAFIIEVASEFLFDLGSKFSIMMNDKIEKKKKSKKEDIEMVLMNEGNGLDLDDVTSQVIRLDGDDDMVAQLKGALSKEALETLVGTLESHLKQMKQILKEDEEESLIKLS